MDKIKVDAKLREAKNKQSAVLSLALCEIADLSPLVAPLAALTNLTELSLGGNQLSAFPQALLALPQLEMLLLYGNPIGDVPAEILGAKPHSDCSNAARSHFDDKASGEVLDREVKLIILGNAGVGKTSLRKRLIHNITPAENSTHGIELETWHLSLAGDELSINVWDFGGQDIYHGTHSLFLRSKALFLIVWDCTTERQPGYELDGIRYEHYPLAYWLKYVESIDPNARVIVVENKCDDARASPLPASTLKQPSFAVSAQEGHGREVLLAQIREFARQELADTGRRRIGRGRWNVKQRLLEYMEEGRRTISYTEFEALCQAQQGAVSSPEALLRYLHNTGVLFYDELLFEGRIILDQRWAIEAIYTVLDRGRCYRQLRRRQGRFTRQDLDDLAWEGRFEVAEQRLFLTFMESCAICFPLDRQSADGATYLAPDLLPEKEEVKQQISQYDEAPWSEADRCFLRYTYEFLHPDTMRRLLVNWGREFGDRAIYWKSGMLVIPPNSSTVLDVEGERNIDGNPAKGQITIRARGDRAEATLNWARGQLERLHDADTVAVEAVSRDGADWITLERLAAARQIGSVESMQGNVLDIRPFMFVFNTGDAADSSVLPSRKGARMSAREQAGDTPIYISYA